ncbi:MAG: hypothetical protein DMD64_00725 [Gemmatimonadetes bacterium]|nr:MAG: hypothetical protein DMD64_00725 [Gemmatimonadota bacterium]
MRVYKTNEIRNVAVVGHGASGKTSLVDALAFVAGTSKRHGSVKDGTALTDYSPDEIERKYSINLALAVAEWMDTKINLIATPWRACMLPTPPSWCCPRRRASKWEPRRCGTTASAGGCPACSSCR